MANCREVNHCKFWFKMWAHVVFGASLTALRRCGFACFASTASYVFLAPYVVSFS
jgi:hypothetical protein